MGNWYWANTRWICVRSADGKLTIQQVRNRFWKRAQRAVSAILQLAVCCLQHRKKQVAFLRRHIILRVGHGKLGARRPNRSCRFFEVAPPDAAPRFCFEQLDKMKREPMGTCARSGFESTAANALFQTTHWSVVLAAGQCGSPQAAEALEKLCRTYWPALYSYIRRNGYPAAQAEDLTQEFFARILDKEHLRDVSREGGRFRSYLLTMLKHFLINEWRRSQCRKRGGGKVFLSLDDLNNVEHGLLEPAESATPEILYERRWALTVLEQAMDRLRQEYVAAGKTALFESLQVYLSGDKGLAPYAEIAGTLGLSAGAVKVAVHRLRRRYGELVRQEVAQTVALPEEIEDEIRHLFSVLAK
jgi:RNA polymerase sigma factor (sigma-70 family)